MQANQGGSILLDIRVDEVTVRKLASRRTKMDDVVDGSDGPRASRNFLGETNDCAKKIPIMNDAESRL